MDEPIRLLVRDEVATWLQTAAQEHHGGDIAAYIAWPVTREYQRNAGEYSPERIRESLNRHAEWERTEAPPEYFEEYARIYEGMSENTAEYAAEFRQHAANAAARDAH